MIMNEFDHRILAPLKQQRERPVKFRPERGFDPTNRPDSSTGGAPRA